MLERVTTGLSSMTDLVCVVSHKDVVAAMPRASCLLLTHQAVRHSQTHTHVQTATLKSYDCNGAMINHQARHGKSTECCVCVCPPVCLCTTEPLESTGPCRGLGVLIRQPQPRREHHRKKMETREIERRNDWRVSEGSKPILMSSGGWHGGNVREDARRVRRLKN